MMTDAEEVNFLRGQLGGLRVVTTLLLGHVARLEGTLKGEPAEQSVLAFLRTLNGMLPSAMATIEQRSQHMSAGLEHEVELFTATVNQSLTF